ncbi:hypothetical protein CPB86DRAFT_662497, partial [Serendipita vermifera]
DFILNFPGQVELFWMRPWNAFKALFLIVSRMYSLHIKLITKLARIAMPLSDCTRCHVLLWSGLFGSSILIAVLNLAILSRVVALWNRSRVVKVVATVLALVNILAFTIAGTRTLATASVRPQTFPFTGCLAVPKMIDIKLNLLVIPAFTFETYAVVLTFIKVYPMAKETGVRLPILTVLLNDGIVYYMSIIVSQGLTFASSYPRNVSMLLPIVMVSAIACNRLFIRLQGVL